MFIESLIDEQTVSFLHLSSFSSLRCIKRR